MASAAAQDLLHVALELPEPEREALALALLDSIGSEEPAAVHDAWQAEVRRRLDDLDAGRVTAGPWEEARRRIFAR